MDILWAFLFCVFIGPVFGDNVSSKARSCSDVRQFYNGKGFSLSGVPQAEISGEHLRICSQGYTCCTSVMEDELAGLGQREVEGLVKEAGRSLQISLSGQYKSFEGHFVDLMNRSENSLQEFFRVTHGSLYARNVRVFHDLYGDLRRYYRGSAVNLEEALNDFWARLLERLFKDSNPQYTIGDEYLECAVKQAETLRPFGDTPRDLKLKVTHAFVAARSFVQGLVVSGEVVRKVSLVSLSPECMRAVMKLTYCPHCRGMGSAKPCANYCRNVMKGCLANQADLDTEWRNLVDAMLQVAERFKGPASIDMVMASFPTRISEAIMTMQENLEVFTSKVFQACGNPRMAGTHSSATEEIQKREKITEDRTGITPSSTTGARLEKLVFNVTAKLKDVQQYWVQLPGTLCSDKVVAGPANEDKCWNGMARASYLPEVMGDGLASQINNPEVEIDITKPDMTIRQQIMQLKIMTNRLKNAFNGNDVDFQDTSDDVSGSGSGMCADELCPRGPHDITPDTVQPILIASPSEKKVKATGSRLRPCSALLLLSLAMLLLRR
ncbi:glypican-1-like [Anguilla rostrata]|uniref:glypican-1-like n=1 Tax=Anguilla rostrata TaxID=7938 RepID=UPI0030D479F1